MLPSRSPTGRTRQGEPAPPDAHGPARPAGRADADVRADADGRSDVDRRAEADHRSDAGIDADAHAHVDGRADAAKALPLTRLRLVALPLVARLRAGRPSHEARAAASLALAEAVARDLPELPRAADVAANARAVEDFWDGLLTASAALDVRHRASNGPEPDLSSLVVARCLLVAGLSARRAKAATTPPKRRAAPDERGWPPTRETKLRRVVEIVERHLEPWVRIGGAELISQEAAGLCADLRRAFPEDFRNITLDRCRDALARWAPGRPPKGQLSTNDVAALLIASAGPFKAAEATRARLRRDIDRAVARAATGPLRRAGPAA